MMMTQYCLSVMYQRRNPAIHPEPIVRRYSLFLLAHVRHLIVHFWYHRSHDLNYQFFARASTTTAYQRKYRYRDKQGTGRRQHWFVQFYDTDLHTNRFME